MNEVYSFKSPEGASLILTNVTEKSIDVTFDVFFELNPPMKALTITLPPERVAVIELSKPFANEGYRIPEGSFSLVIMSEVYVPITVFK